MTSLKAWHREEEKPNLHNVPYSCPHFCVQYDPQHHQTPGRGRKEIRRNSTDRDRTQASWKKQAEGVLEKAFKGKA